MKNAWLPIAAQAFPGPPDAISCSSAAHARLQMQRHKGLVWGIDMLVGRSSADTALEMNWTLIEHLIALDQLVYCVFYLGTKTEVAGLTRSGHQWLIRLLDM